MKGAEPRGRMTVMREFFELTKEMAGRKDDGDYLVQAIDKRQTLMEEYNALETANKTFPLTTTEKGELKAMAKEILALDTKITKALEVHKIQAKNDVSRSNSQQKLMGYVGQGIASSGSYMDYKK